MITAVLTIEKNGEPIHQFEVEVAGGEELGEEHIVEELRALSTEWATPWLGYPGTKVSIHSTALK